MREIEGVVAAVAAVASLARLAARVPIAPGEPVTARCGDDLLETPTARKPASLRRRFA
jgi:hypothetical protein